MTDQAAASANTPNREELTAKQLAARPLIQTWLFSLCSLIFAIVLVGGATRLTGSGLSITEWKPIMGAIPPLNAADWAEAFEKYKAIPQYQKINYGMSLDEFKSIFWWEWAHRFLGRFIGIAFLLPFLFFLFTKRLETSLKPTLWIMFALGGLQGFIGWYMVASGLVERTEVSQYRLALHLGLAIFIYGCLFWIALGLGKQQKPAMSGPKSGRMVANVLLGLIFLQIIAGAFVAGLKAGEAFNTWPLMDQQVIPNGLWTIEPLWKNLFENIRTVQFDHRILAYIIALAGLAHLVQVWRQSNTGIGASSIKSALILTGAIFTQIGLGIWTLLKVVPLDLALAHQGMALILFSIALWHRRAMA